MFTLNIHRNIKKLLIVVSLVLFFVGFVVYSNIDQIPGNSGDFLVYRLLRSLSSFVFLMLIVIFQKNAVSKPLLLFILLYTLSSFLTVWYENNILATLSMGLNALSFLILSFYLFFKIKNIKIDFFVISSFILIIIILSYLGYQFADSFKEHTLSGLHYVFIVSSVVFIVVNTFLGIIYNHKYNTKNSLIFMGFQITLLFAEVFRGIAYYTINDEYIVIHISRGLLIMSMALFSFYALFNNDSKEGYKNCIK